MHRPALASYREETFKQKHYEEDAKGLQAF